MAKRERPGGGSPPTKKSKDKSGEVSVLCVTCNKQAEEDSIECECCFKWVHRECAGISKDEYKVLSDSSSNIMFFCGICQPKVTIALKFFNDIQEKQKSLDEKVTQLEERLNSIASSVIDQDSTTDITQPTNNTSLVHTNASKTQPNTIRRFFTPPKPPSLVSDKRYNVVFYGVDEPPKETSRSDRQKHDLDKLLNILSSLDSSLTSASIKDFHRLGKFKQNNTRPRPLLLKFLRAFEASLILSKKGSLTSSQISIKPDMSPDERKVENALLKERRSLINNGIERKYIKIRGNSLYVHNKLYGQFQNSEFCRSQYNPPLNLDCPSDAASSSQATSTNQPSSSTASKSNQ